MSVLVLLLILLFVIFCIQCKTKFIWKIYAAYKWKNLQPSLQKIKIIHREVIEDEKTIKWLKKKRYKQDFYDFKEIYDEYTGFCKNKNLELPVECDEIESILDTTEDIFLSLDELFQKKANQYDVVYNSVESAGEQLLVQRKESLKSIERIEELINSIACNPKSFKTDIETISIQKNKFKDLIEYRNEDQKALKKSVVGIGAGIAAGATTAGLAPTVAMWIATTFGVSSTGTAISALSGAAATKAALAWLGGGALAVGGGGVAAGQALLVLAGPIGCTLTGATIALSTINYLWKRRTINKSKNEDIENIIKSTEVLKEIEGKINIIFKESCEVFECLKVSFKECEKLRGKDYTTFSDEEKQMLGALVNNTKSFSELLNKTIEA